MRSRTKYFIIFAVFFLAHLIFAIYFCYISDHWGAPIVVMIADFPLSNLIIEINDKYFLGLYIDAILCIFGSLWYGLIGMLLMKIYQKLFGLE